MTDEVSFRSGSLLIPPRTLHKLPLRSTREDARYAVRDGGLAFCTRGWFEILLSVSWDPANTEGTRFSHTAITDQHPLHSEAINAAVLAQLSDGKQLLRGNTIFEPGKVDHITLEVWHDADAPIEILEASLDVRDLNSTPGSPPAVNQAL
jgi:hypothetical protein